MHSLLDSLCKHTQAGELELTDLSGELREVLDAPKSWVDMLWAYLTGVEVMLPIVLKSALVTGRAVMYPKVLEDFLIDPGDGIIDEVSGVPPAERSQALAQVSLLRLIARLYACQARVRDEPTMPGSAWRPVARMLQDDAKVEEVIDWLETGALASSIHNLILDPLRRLCFEGLAAEFQVTAAVTAEDFVAVRPVNEKSLSLLISADVGAMVAVARSYMEFGNADGPVKADILPHARHCIVFTRFLEETSRGGVHAATFQHTIGEAKAR